MGIQFHEFFKKLNFPGIQFHEFLYNSNFQVQLVKERGQVIFVWTDDQNDPATFKYLKELGINGLIYDR